MALSRHGRLIRRGKWLLAFLPLLLALALRGYAWIGRCWANAGMAVLGQAALAGEDRELAAHAETLLERAAAFAPDRRSTWRGLGFALAAQGRAAEAVAVWSAAGGMADELMRRGSRAWQEGRRREAVVWYQRAAEVEPDLGDAWYYVGFSYERMEQYEDALEAYTRAEEAEVFRSIGRSTPYCRAGFVYSRRLTPPRWDEAQAAYGQAVALDDFGAAAEAADCHYQRGQAIQQAGGDPEEAMAEYRRAIELDPQHASAHSALGLLYYEQGNVTAAEAEILEAIRIAPRNAGAYVDLGDIYCREGRVDEAAAMYRQALEVSPDFAAARRRLQSLCAGE